GKRERIDMVDRHGGIEQIGLARAWAAAAHVDGGDRRSGEYDRRGSRRQTRGVPVADREAGHTRKALARPDTLLIPSPTRCQGPASDSLTFTECAFSPIRSD